MNKANTPTERHSDANHLREKIKTLKEKIHHLQSEAIAGNLDAIRQQSIYYQKIEVTENRINGVFSKPQSAALTVYPPAVNIR